jgi:hypothetical protein
MGEDRTNPGAAGPAPRELRSDGIGWIFTPARKDRVPGTPIFTPARKDRVPGTPIAHAPRIAAYTAYTTDLRPPIN